MVKYFMRGFLERTKLDYKLIRRKYQAKQNKIKNKETKKNTDGSKKI